MAKEKKCLWHLEKRKNANGTSMGTILANNTHARPLNPAGI
jgi:hypothetical protein